MAKKKVEMPREDEQHLPEMEPVRNEKVHRAALRYRKAILERVALSKKEHEAHDHLLGVMGEEGIGSYEYKGLAVYVDTKSKCVVKVASEKSPEEDAE